MLFSIATTIQHLMTHLTLWVCRCCDLLRFMAWIYSSRMRHILVAKAIEVAIEATFCLMDAVAQLMV